MAQRRPRQISNQPEQQAHVNSPLLTASSPTDPQNSITRPPEGCRRLLQYRSILLILLWNFVVTLCFTVTTDSIIVASLGFKNTGITFSVLGLYGILAVGMLFYPLAGFMADVCCGRYRIVMASLTILWIALSLFSIMAVILSFHHYGHIHHEEKFAAIIAILGILAFILFVVSFSGFQSNILQFGLDQLLEVPSKYLSVFIHFLGWTDIVGHISVHFFYMIAICEPAIFGKVIFYIPHGLLVILTVLLGVSCFNHSWFHTEPGHTNPYKSVLNVLRFYVKNKNPVGARQSWTYCEDELPSRIDLAKSKYGGYYENEDVENVKTFLRILGVILSLGPLFVLEIPTSHYIFPQFATHATHRFPKNNCTSEWIILQTGTLAEIVTVVLLPLYIWLIYFALQRRIPKILHRLGCAVAFCVLTIALMFITDYAGHSTTTNSNITCAFTTDYKDENKDLTTLNIHWGVLILPNILLGVGPILIHITMLEFIAAQSPQPMKGLLVGVYFATKGLFRLVGAILLVPISLVWGNDMDTNVPMVQNKIPCGATYYLIVALIGITGAALFYYTARRYRYRVRDDPWDIRNVLRIPAEDYFSSSPITVEDRSLSHTDSLPFPHTTEEEGYGTFDNCEAN